MENVLIVGAGLSGISVASRLLDRGVNVSVVHSRAKPSSTAMATGIANPIVFKRITKSWMVAELLPEMKTFYKKLSLQLNHEFYREVEFRKQFASRDYQLLWDEASESDSMQPWIDPGDGSFGRVHHAGVLDCNGLMRAYHRKLESEDRLSEQLFDPTLLAKNGALTYNGVAYDAVVCCEGPHALQNPFFSWLSFKPCKGEWVTIECSEDLGNAIVHCGINVIPQGENLYTLSSTFEWDRLNWETTPEGEQKLCAIFEKHFQVEYRVVARGAGIRPTVSDRRPLLGEHPVRKGLYIFNGLGTKGVMLAPWFSRHFCEHLLDGKPLLKEVDIQRYGKRFRRTGVNPL